MDHSHSLNVFIEPSDSSLSCHSWLIHNEIFLFPLRYSLLQQSVLPLWGWAFVYQTPVSRCLCFPAHTPSSIDKALIFCTGWSTCWIMPENQLNLPRFPNGPWLIIDTQSTRAGGSTSQWRLPGLVTRESGLWLVALTAPRVRFSVNNLKLCLLHPWVLGRNRDNLLKNVGTQKAFP